MFLEGMPFGSPKQELLMTTYRFGSAVEFQQSEADPDEPILIKKQSLSDVDVADSCAERGRVIIALPMYIVKCVVISSKGTYYQVDGR